MPLIAAICQQCGKEFTRQFHSTKPAKYCSQQCVHDSQKHNKYLICEQCGKEYKCTHKEQKYCSDYCSKQSRRLYPDTTCPICGIIFAPRKSKSLTYCSDKCQKIGIKNPNLIETRKCKQCGKEFVIYKNKIKTRKNRGMYCSRKCFVESQHKPDSYTTKQCLNCGKLFKVSKVQVRYYSNRGKFCSNKCRVKYSVGENHPRWKENKVIYDPGPNWYIQRAKALERDNYKCQNCGISYDENIIDVHHIIKCRLFNGDYERANDLSNLITLCRTCHPKVERGEIPCPIPKN